jgi:uncharacterized protein (TIGR00288 family)
MATESIRADVAVFIDFENVYVSVRDKLDVNPNFESIMERCEDLGRVVIARAYADWYRYPRVTSALYANGIEPMYVPTYYYDKDVGRIGRAIKNSVDMNLCVDAMKTLFTNPNIKKFVLATGDRDFIPLVNTIRQQGKEVIIIGVGGAASAHLAQSADEFIFYEALIGKKPGAKLLQDQPKARMPDKGRDQGEADNEPEVIMPPLPTPPIAPIVTNGPPVVAPRISESQNGDVFDVLVQAIRLARERGYVCSFGSLKLLMKELMGGEFRESRYKDASGRPFAKFKDFVMEGERRGKIQVFTNGTVNEVFLPGEDPYALSQFAHELKEEPPPTETTDFREGRTTGGGRRRRRRPRGSGRPLSAHPSQEFEEQYEEQSDDGFESELLPELPDLVDDLPVLDDLLPPDDTMLDNLLDQLTEADAHLATMELPIPAIYDAPLAALEPEDAPIASTLEMDTVAPEPVVAPESATAISDLVALATLDEATLVGTPFTDAEWETLMGIIRTFERPVSFQQIHDATREARNRNEILRTNEELRTMIKQAINTGMLERSGKGARIVYRIAEPKTDEAETGSEPVLETASVDVVPSEQLATEIEEIEEIEYLPQVTIIEEIIETEEQPAVVEAPKPSKAKSSSRRKPKVESVAEIIAPVAEPVAEPAKPAAKKSSRSKPKAAAPVVASEAPVAEAPQELASTTPARKSSRRKPAVKAAESTVNSDTSDAE